MRTKLEAKGEQQKIVLDYIEANASDMLVEKINSGEKNLWQCWQYITSEAKKQAKNGCACISDTEVFGWAMHFFEEESIPATTNYHSAAAPKKEEEKEQKPAAVEKPKIVPVPVKKEEPKKITKTSSADLEGQLDIFAILGGAE